MPGKIAITSAEGQTGHLLADLLLNGDAFADKVQSLTLTTTNPQHAHIKELANNPKVSVVPIQLGDDSSVLAQHLQKSGAEVIMVIPPSHKDKLEFTELMVEATKEAGIPNVVLLSSAGADMADPTKQPRLREFIDLEQMVMVAKGDTSTATGHSPCVIRAGFYAENLLLYNKQAQSQGKLPLPIGEAHKFAPVALGDVALVAAHVLTSEGPHGLGDNVRGQLITLTGPMLASGDELATAASQALGLKMEFEDISEAEAKKVLDNQADISDAEKEYLLEYYALVREGKTNYISTHAYHDITGEHPQEPPDFFKTYGAEFKPKRRKVSKS